MENNIKNREASLDSSPLGKKSPYIDQYSPDLLFPIKRQHKRTEINVPSPIPFYGYDTWNAYELSWLDTNHKPHVAIARFDISCHSKNIIESKSFKLYLNSFNNSVFSSWDKVKETLVADIQNAVEGEIRVAIFPLSEFTGQVIQSFDGTCLDEQDIVCERFEVKPNILSVSDNTEVSEILYSNLLKSNCLVTGQPDWGSIQIKYRGPKINHESLLRYIISYRNHNEFHEQCVERIYMDISNYCGPKALIVTARYTRRGGLDINPVRSSCQVSYDENLRMARQ